MHYVYVIQDSTDSLYIGVTGNLELRLAQHNRGDTHTTACRKNWEIRYYEAYQTRALAEAREQQLKHYGKAWQGLKQRIGVQRTRKKVLG